MATTSHTLAGISPGCLEGITPNQAQGRKCTSSEGAAEDAILAP